MHTLFAGTSACSLPDAGYQMQLGVGRRPAITLRDIPCIQAIPAATRFYRVCRSHEYSILWALAEAVACCAKSCCWNLGEALWRVLWGSHLTQGAGTAIKAQRMPMATMACGCYPQWETSPANRTSRFTLKVQTKDSGVVVGGQMQHQGCGCSLHQHHIHQRLGSPAEWSDARSPKRKPKSINPP